MTGNPFAIPKAPTSPRGFHQSPGCSCKICSEATFTTIISPPNLPGRGFTIPAPINCQAVNLVYAIFCPCGLLYVGRTSLPKPRWSNHKSHIRKGHRTCNLATHYARVHRHLVDKLTLSSDIKEQFIFTLLESVGPNGSEAALEQLEETWRTKLLSWAPSGLNTREDGPKKMRNKKLHLAS